MTKLEKESKRAISSLLVLCVLAVIWIPLLIWLYSHFDWDRVFGALIAFAGNVVIVIAFGSVAFVVVCVVVVVAGILPPGFRRE
jgi:hypothetical protein